MQNAPTLAAQGLRRRGFCEALLLKPPFVLPENEGQDYFFLRAVAVSHGEVSIGGRMLGVKFGAQELGTDRAALFSLNPYRVLLQGISHLLTEVGGLVVAALHRLDIVGIVAAAVQFIICHNLVGSGRLQPLALAARRTGGEQVGQQEDEEG